MQNEYYYRRKKRQCENSCTMNASWYDCKLNPPARVVIMNKEDYRLEVEKELNNNDT